MTTNDWGRYEPCPFCRSYRWEKRPHKCPPLFHVHHEDSHGEMTEFGDHASIHAHSPEEAAETWAERHDADSLEYDIVGGNRVEVRVRSSDGGDWVWYSVEGEAVPSYRAEQGRLE